MRGDSGQNGTLPLDYISQDSINDPEIYDEEGIRALVHDIETNGIRDEEEWYRLPEIYKALPEWGRSCLYHTMETVGYQKGSLDWVSRYCTHEPSYECDNTTTGTYYVFYQVV